ncbi:MAG: hypothetical protein FWE84_05445 [Firmicutes bacterium]|nr:hypothetical protein [Bacillota bacterium]
MKKRTKQTVKRYDFVKRPKKPNAFFRWLIGVISKIAVGGEYKVTREGMDGLKPPYLILTSHMSFFDFSVMARATRPYGANNVCALDGINDYGEWLMRQVGVIGKRKFIKDLNLLRNMKHSVSKLNNTVILYPEAKYSIQGATSFLPLALGKLAKFMGVPVVVTILHGDYVAQPQWNVMTKAQKKSGKRKVPLHCEMKLVASLDEVRALSEDELQKRIEKAFVYDDFKWQKDNNIIINHPERARGLNKLLYQCAACGVEHKMYSESTEIYCEACGKRWMLSELGQLHAVGGETEFEHIPDWFEWQRKNVQKQVLEGTYHFEDEVRVETLPGANGFFAHGTGHLVHCVDGLTLTCNAYGEPITVHWDGISTDGLHIEYSYKKGLGSAEDVLDISTQDESYWLYPLNKRDVITKASLATDEIYKLRIAEARKK